MKESKSVELNNLQRQLSLVVSQKAALTNDLSILENTLESVKSTQGCVYRIVGGLVIEYDREKLLKELEDTVKALKDRIELLDTQEKRLREKISELSSGGNGEKSKKAG